MTRHSSKLRISDGLALDLDAVTKTFAILAQRRKGKTYTANVVAEEMVAAGQPWVALDPTGAWWGLRSSADGRKAGLPVLVVGGEHGQLPLERTAGKLMADLVVDDPGWYVFDFSLFESKAAERQFATDFAERFYRRKAKSTGPIHLFVDEADVFVPQRSPSGDQRMLGAFEAIVRRGGIRGIGTTLISQRAAVVNKNVLEQIDVLVVLRTLGPNDQKAIKAYVDAFGAPEQQADLMGSLAQLGLGEAWVWEPGGDLFERVQIRERKTYNSSATPKAGERRAEPLRLADVDLDALRDKIEATVEKAKAEDPVELRKRIGELERELRERPDTPAEPVEVKVPVLGDDDAALLRDAAASARESLGEATRLAGEIDDLVKRAEAVAAAPRHQHPPAPRPAPGRPPRPPREPSGDLSGPQQRILDALASLQVIGLEQVTKTQLALFAKASPKSSSFANNLGALRTAGLIDYPRGGFVALTEAGEGVADSTQAPRTVEELQEYVRGLVGPAKARLLDELIHAYPSALHKGDLAERAGVSAGSSSYANNLGGLRSLGLIDYPGPGEVVALSVLFLE